MAEQPDGGNPGGACRRDVFDPLDRDAANCQHRQPGANHHRTQTLDAKRHCARLGRGGIDRSCDEVIGRGGLDRILNGVD